MSSITILQRPSNGNDPDHEARTVFSKINSLVESLRIACGYDRDAGLCDDGRVRKYIRKSFPRRISIEGEAFRLGGVFTDAFGDQRIHYIAEGSVWAIFRLWVGSREGSWNWDVTWGFLWKGETYLINSPDVQMADPRGLLFLAALVAWVEWVVAGTKAKTRAVIKKE